MRAMVLDNREQAAATARCAKAEAGRGQLLVRVSACAVCRTDLHVVDGELPDPKLPLILGHQIVGRVEEIGEEADSKFSDRRSRREFRGSAGRMATALIVDRPRESLRSARVLPATRSTAATPSSPSPMRDSVFDLPDRYNDVDVAPLLCAGLIGYRSYRKTGDARRLGIYGFGNAAHLIAQVALYEGRELFAFTRPGDTDNAAKQRER